MHARPTYGAKAPGDHGALVGAVESGSPAARAGVTEGDIIETVAGEPLRDLIDWRWYADGPEVSLGVRRLSRESGERVSEEVAAVRHPGESWGIEFAETVFDGVRTCDNRCSFCFMSQLPKGLRRALYVRDDDYRLSFLQGNFVTLTNLDDADVRRIVEQHLSPLYVSLHAVRPEVRDRLVCVRGKDRALEFFDALVEGGIETHVQIVAVPGINDGEELDVTLNWLAEREGVLSVGVVPLGYTAHQTAFDRSYEDPGDAARMIEQVQRWQFAMRERDGVTWVHLADEFYLNARAPFPLTEWYDGFPQYENGIGMVRSFVDETIALQIELEAAVLALPETDSVTVVTGALAATTLAGALEAVGAVGRVRLLVVPNRFFGGNVNVSGLLSGVDIAGAIAADARHARTRYVAPDVIFNSDGLTLDDLTAEQVRAAAGGAEVTFASPDPAGLLGALQGYADRPVL